MKIRKYNGSDLDQLKIITAICFKGVSIEQKIEERYGSIAGKNWPWRKQRHIDADVQANADGIFVAEENGQVIGYITTRVDYETKIAGIPNFAVLPGNQKKGIGRQLFDMAFECLRHQGMEYVRIETLDCNQIGLHFYPKIGFHEIARQVQFIMPLSKNVQEEHEESVAEGQKIEPQQIGRSVE